MAEVLGNLLGNRDITPFSVKKVDEGNMERRLPVIILVDTSGSMQGTETMLQQSVKDLYRTLRNDPIACPRVELSVMSFNSDLQILEPMRELEQHEAMGSNLAFRCEGCTYTGLALKMSIMHLEDRLKVFREHRPRIRYYSPILFLLSDGKPECYDNAVIPEEQRAMSEARAYIKKNVAERKLSVIAVEIGNGCDHDLMRDLTGLNDDKHVAKVSDKFQLAAVFKFTSTLISYSSRNTHVDISNVDVKSFQQEECKDGR